MDILTTLGTFASLLGAWYAWNQANKSKSAASQAEEVKKLLINHSDITNTSRLEPLSKISINKMRKYSVTSVDELSGVSPKDDADHVQEFINELHAASEYFPKNKVEEVYANINGLIQDFVNTTNEGEVKRLGNEIHNELVAFSAPLKKVSKAYQQRTE